MYRYAQLRSPYHDGRALGETGDVDVVLPFREKPGDAVDDADFAFVP